MIQVVFPQDVGQATIIVNGCLNTNCGVGIGTIGAIGAIGGIGAIGTIGAIGAIGALGVIVAM